MLYIFLVDTGKTITFDIKLALQTVSVLKEAIERECGVATGDQVLLMSGGESLEPHVRVCSYSAGTDTNPIYLFSKASIDNSSPPAANIDYGSDIDLQNQVDASLSLPPTYQTLVARATLAQQCWHLAREQAYICERLVHDQHLMQQGWAAVVANLEDITLTFRNKTKLFEEFVAVYLSEREQHMQLLSNFRTDLQTLEKIPILPALRGYAEGFMSPDEPPPPPPPPPPSSSTSGSEAATDASSDSAVPMVEDAPQEVLSLFKWIAAKDNQNSLETFAETCMRGLEQFDERAFDIVKAEIHNSIETAGMVDMKEIKGLGDRLYALEELMIQAKKFVHDQNELAQGFLQNKTRVSNLNDDSVLPDLCTSHRRQLLVMLDNHNHLRDIRRRCTKAKEELSTSIHRRLKWISFVENRMMDLSSKIVMCHETIRRQRRQLEILRQINQAPEMYVSAITEVVRRRTFSQAFLTWAGNLACQLLAVHSEELERRREFQNKFQGHFLNNLFPGLEDMPPPYAIEAPSVFDNSLPKLTAEDMESLRQQIPDLAASVSTPDLNSITQFFFSRSFTDSNSDGNKEKESMSMRVDPPPKELEETRRDRGDFESETDTEEFEKISQAAMDSKQTSFDSTKQQLQASRQKQLEENLGNSREEVERLRIIIYNLKNIATDSLTRMRQELIVLKQDSLSDRDDVVKRVEEINDMIKLQICALREHEQEVTVDHELELSDFKKMLQLKEEQIQTLSRQIGDKEIQEQEQDKLINTMRQKFEGEQQEIKKMRSIYRQFEERLEQTQVEKESALKETNEAKLSETQLKSSLKQYEDRIRELEEKLVTAEIGHQKAIKEEAEKLQLEYKTQIDTIRSRFKLMAASTMERSPSDSSLEKIERVDVIELINHETILAQAKKDMENEKEEAIRLAVEHKCTALNRDLQIANGIIHKYEEEINVYRQTKMALDEAQNVIRTLERDKNSLEQSITTDREKLQEKEKLVQELEEERDKLRNELNEELLKMSQTNSEPGAALKSLESSSNDEIRVSESKKVRLEENSDVSYYPGKIDDLKADNRRLNSDLRAMRENKERTEAKIEALENERARLESELEKERSKRNSVVEPMSSSTSDSSQGKDMITSVAVVSEAPSMNRVDVSTSTERSRSYASREASTSSTSLRDKIPKSTSTVLHNRLSFTTCNPGDLVLILWDQPHRNFTVLQESTIFYFLNSDCLGNLDLQIGPEGLPNRMHIVAEVIDKEYCSARKPENRYKVPQGTKFYRVRVKPAQRPSLVASKSQKKKKKKKKKKQNKNKVYTSSF